MKKFPTYQKLPKVPKGYRRVMPGRVIKNGDKYFSPAGNEWRKTISPGDRVRAPYNAHLFYIRAI